MEWNEQTLSKELSHHESWLMSTPGVEGVGIGVDSGGEKCLKIYTTQKNEDLERKISRKLGAVPVDFEITGGIEAQ